MLFIWPYITNEQDKLCPYSFDSDKEAILYCVICVYKDMDMDSPPPHCSIEYKLQPSRT